MAWSVILVAYGNGIAFADRFLFPGAWHFPAPVGAAAAALMLLVALGYERMRPAEMGLTWRGLVRGVVIGTLAGSLTAGVGALLLRHPPFLDGPIVYDPVAGIPATRALDRVFVTMPLDTILPEEIAFRGFLLALYLRVMGPGRAVLLSSVVFSAWHVVVNYDTITRTNLAEDPLLLYAGIGGAHLLVFAGGLAFCVLRLGLSHLAAPTAAHWAVNSGIIFAMRLP